MSDNTRENSAKRRVFLPNIAELRDLITAIRENNDRLMEAERSDVNSVNHRYEDLIKPHRDELEADFHNEVAAALHAVSTLYDYNTTRAHVVETMTTLINALQRYVDQHARETCFQAIRDIFGFFDNPADASNFMAEVVNVANTAYQDCMAKHTKSK